MHIRFSVTVRPAIGEPGAGAIAVALLALTLAVAAYFG
jgi:hypothetical protein